MTAPIVPDQLQYVSDPSVREVFADQIRLLHWDGSNARIEFAVTRPELTGPNQAISKLHPAARLVLSPQALMMLSEQLAGLVAQLEKTGVVKRVVATGGTKQ